MFGPKSKTATVMLFAKRREVSILLLRWASQKKRKTRWDVTVRTPKSTGFFLIFPFHNFRFSPHFQTQRTVDPWSVAQRHGQSFAIDRSGVWCHLFVHLFLEQWCLGKKRTLKSDDDNSRGADVYEHIAWTIINLDMFVWCLGKSYSYIRGVATSNQLCYSIFSDRG